MTPTAMEALYLRQAGEHIETVPWNNWNRLIKLSYQLSRLFSLAINPVLTLVTYVQQTQTDEQSNRDIIRRTHTLTFCPSKTLKSKLWFPQVVHLR